jgi:hypothetical protein
VCSLSAYGEKSLGAERFLPQEGRLRVVRSPPKRRGALLNDSAEQSAEAAEKRIGVLEVEFVELRRLVYTRGMLF